MMMIVMFMRVAVVVIMILRMAVTMSGVSRIGAAQRAERLQDLADRGAEPFEHRLR